MIKVLAHYFTVELKLMLRNKGDWIPVLLLYSLTIALFGFSLSRETELLIRVSPVVIWVAVLFSMLTMSELALRKDLEEGWLSQLKLSPYPLWLFMLSKALAYWLLLGLGFIVLLPLVSFWLYFDASLAIGLGIVFLITTPALILLMMLAASLTVGLPQPGLLLGLLLLPLYTPILILGQSAVATLQLMQKPIFEGALLAAISILCALFLPFLCSLTLQQTSED